VAIEAPTDSAPPAASDPAPLTPRGRLKWLGGGSGRAGAPRLVVLAVVVLVVAYLALTPLLFLLRNTFFANGGFSVHGFADAYASDTGAVRMLVNSLGYAAGSAALALILGTALAWVHVRTDVPGKSLLFATCLGPLVVPSVLYAVSWTFLGDSHIGLLNTYLFKPVFGHSILNIYSLPGMILVQGLHHTPVAFLFMMAAFRGLDPSLEESAQMSGASRARLMRRITIPLLRPAVLAATLLVFVQSMEGFEVPAILGLQGGIFVFTSRIYYALQNYPIHYDVAGAYALALVALAVLGVLLVGVLSRRASSYQTIGGKAFRQRPISLGRWKPLVTALVGLYMLIALVLPLAMLVYASFLPYYAAPSAKAFHHFSLDAYRMLFQVPGLGSMVENTLLLGVLAASIVVVLTSISSWLVVRTKLRGRRVIDALAFTPLVIPGLVLGLALSFVYLRLHVGVYGTIWILLIAYVTKYLPYGMRYAGGALTQVSTELEESALVSGASWWGSMRRIVLPLARNGLIAGWIYILLISVRELGATVLLYSPNKQVLSILMFQEFQSGQFTVLAALGVLLVVALIILVALFRRIGRGINTDADAQL
jgi:iron(III) transport system permease protein